MHFMLHGVGGFFGGLIGWFFFARVDHCTGTCTTILNGTPTSTEGTITVGALAGIVLWHVGKAGWEDYQDRQRRKQLNP